MIFIVQLVIDVKSKRACHETLRTGPSVCVCVCVCVCACVCACVCVLACVRVNNH